MKMNSHPAQPIHGSIVTHIVKTYASNGKIKLPNTSGGIAMRNALIKRNVRV